MSNTKQTQPSKRSLQLIQESYLHPELSSGNYDKRLHSKLVGINKRKYQKQVGQSLSGTCLKSKHTKSLNHNHFIN